MTSTACDLHQMLLKRLTETLQNRSKLRYVSRDHLCFQTEARLVSFPDKILSWHILPQLFYGNQPDELWMNYQINISIYLRNGCGQQTEQDGGEDEMRKSAGGEPLLRKSSNHFLAVIIQQPADSILEMWSDTATHMNSLICSPGRSALQSSSTV